MNKVYYILFCVMMLCLACEWKLKPNEDYVGGDRIEIQRYDRLESRYLTTGDFAALQQMNTEYPMETRTLIEDVLRLGQVYEPTINSKFLGFYQDSLLQTVISDVETEYASLDDVNESLNQAFGKLSDFLPVETLPVVYSQIGAFTQSIIVGDGVIGISLDKYMGADYPPYARFYSPEQRETMTRAYIVPDCLVFYLLSQYPLKKFDSRSQEEKDVHMGKVMWVVNKAVDKKVFDSPFVKRVGRFMNAHPDVTVRQLLEDDFLAGL